MEDKLQRARDEVLAEFDDATKVMHALAERTRTMVRPNC